MSLQTHASVQIDAPAATVFGWLVEPSKLSAWIGGAGPMPADPRELHVGWSAASSMPLPGGGTRDTTVSVTAYDPPRTLSYVTTYPGGRAVSEYHLTEATGRTTVTCTGDADWAEADLSRVDAGLAHQPILLKWFVHLMVHHAERKLAHGDFDDATEQSMNSALEQTLVKLKQLIEGGAGPGTADRP